MRSVLVRLVVVLAAAAFLAACEDRATRAERHYQSALALIAAGDDDRALIELRNAIKYANDHKGARYAYAQIMLDRGNVPEAYGQYLRLVEQHPDEVEARRILAELAIERGDWTEAERHGRAALERAPDDPALQPVAAALDYRAAAMARDEDARAAVADRALALQATHPDSRILARIVIDRLMAGPDRAATLAALDDAIARFPDSLEFHGQKFRLLAQAEDVAGTGAQLRVMAERFPGNQQVQAALIGWYLVQGDTDGAEAYMRGLAGARTENPETHAALVQLLSRTRGPAAARAELDALVAANAGTPRAALWAATRAALDFETGDRAGAIAALQAVLAAPDAGDAAQVLRLKGMLAQMREATGDRAGARALVDEILAADASNVEALKLRAAWLIDEDKPGEAIVALRLALGQAPRDPGVLTLMAAAHERDGSPELAGERLALAVEASGSAPAESLRYARFLVTQNRRAAAETVLRDSLRAHPAEPQLMTALADIYIADGRWDEANGLAGTLAQAADPALRATAETIRAAILLRQNRTEEGLSFLQAIAAGETGGARATAVLVQTQAQAGRLAEARATLDAALAATPGDPTLRMLDAGLRAMAGDAAGAEAAYRALIADLPAADLPVRQLYGLLLAQGRGDEARAVLAAGLAAIPASRDLRFLAAGERERAGDIEGAIALYEALYAEDTGNTVIANNLASLISTFRTDPDSLERAAAVARRLRGTAVPAFADTYGWIEYRRGNLPEALAHLERAAPGLPDDPLAQFHLGMVYADLGRTAEARAQFERAIALAGDRDLPQIATARDRLATLPAAP